MQMRRTEQRRQRKKRLHFYNQMVAKENKQKTKETNENVLCINNAKQRRRTRVEQKIGQYAVGCSKRVQ